LTNRKLCIAIPASVVSDVPHLREKTLRVGLIGRAAAMFRVDEIVVFPDYPSRVRRTEANLVCTLLQYLETPQYLRKRLFGLNSDLQFAGILPPLRTPHHPLGSRVKDLEVGEFREGVTLSKADKETFVDIGVNESAVIRGTALAEGRRVTVKIVKVGRSLVVELADRTKVPLYWGYRVTLETCPFVAFLKKRGFDLTVATSKYGASFSDVVEKVAEEWGRARGVLIAFGASCQGLREIVGREGRTLDDVVDFVVNTVPMQGTETVRTEEAVLVSLGLFNAVLSWNK
jgi:predicted SPOUT superfamily RNA methylase MTH1